MSSLARRRYLASVLVSSLTAIAFAGCAPKADAPDDGAVVTEDAAAAPDVAPSAPPAPAAPASAERIAAFAKAFNEAQSTRLLRLRFLESRGAVEFRWKDKDGNHFEQCDLRFFAMPPTRTAFRLSKLSELYAWLGSNDDSWWVFRMKDKPSSAEVRPWAASSGDGMSVVSPRSVMTMAGLAPIPAEAGAVTELPGGTFLVTFTGSKEVAPSRWTVDGSTLLPRSIDLFDEAGELLATSTLEEYASAAVDGLPPGDFPRVARRITVARSDGSGSIKLSLDEPTARGEKIRPQFFELKDLLRDLRPEEVIYREGPATPERLAPLDPRSEGQPGGDAAPPSGSGR